jgi:ribosomal protein L5
MPGSGLAWDSSGLTNGTLRVITAQSPHIGSARVSGGNLTISGSSGIPYASYYVLASTNAALPLIQWSRVATNAFDSNGNFTFMESVIPGMPRLFYLVRLP